MPWPQCLAVALVNSGGFEYGLQKLVGFVAFNILSFVLTSITPPERRRRLLYGFVLVGRGCSGERGTWGSLPDLFAAGGVLAAIPSGRRDYCARRRS